MEQTLGNWIKENYAIVKTLTREGVFQPSLLARYHNYNYFLSLKNDSVMVNYDETAEKMGVSVMTVIRSVKQMEKQI